MSRLWDLAAGKTMVTLTHHKKSVRALAIHPTEYSFASGSAGGNNIKKWKCPEGAFVFNFSGHNSIINTLSVNAEGVFFSGGTNADILYHLCLTFVLTGDNGTLTFWDYNTGTPFQNMEDVPQPGSLEAEAGVFCSTFDQTGTRLITGGADKTIKVGNISLIMINAHKFETLIFLDICRAVPVTRIWVRIQRLSPLNIYFVLYFSLPSSFCFGKNIPCIPQHTAKQVILQRLKRAYHSIITAMYVRSAVISIFLVKLQRCCSGTAPAIPYTAKYLN
jgi:WD40 repeat protein